MKNTLLGPSVLALLATHAMAGQPTEIIKQMSLEETSAIPATLVENVLEAADERGDTEARAAVITVFTGPTVAPFTAYLKVFDPIPQDGGDYGSFKVFKVPQMLNEWPKALKVQYARDGRSIYVGFNETYFTTFNNRGEAKYAKGRMITKFSVAKPTSEGAIADTAEFSIRK